MIAANRFLMLMIVVLILCYFPIQLQAMDSKETPSEAVKSASHAEVITIDLIGVGFDVFQSSAFKKEIIRGGHYSANTTSVGFNDSLISRTGQPESLEKWMNLNVPKYENITFNTSPIQTLTVGRSNRTISPNITVLQME